MEIKPPGTGRPPASVPDSGEIQKKPAEFKLDRPQGDVKGTQAEQAGSEALLSLSQTLTEFKRADLNDPVRREQAISRSIGELIDTEPSSKFLSPEQRQEVSGWMSQDPHIRRQVERYLERTLE